MSLPKPRIKLKSGAVFSDKLKTSFPSVSTLTTSEILDIQSGYASAERFLKHADACLNGNDKTIYIGQSKGDVYCNNIQKMVPRLSLALGGIKKQLLESPDSTPPFHPYSYVHDEILPVIEKLKTGYMNSQNRIKADYEIEHLEIARDQFLADGCVNPNRLGDEALDIALHITSARKHLKFAQDISSNPGWRSKYLDDDFCFSSRFNQESSYEFILHNEFMRSMDEFNKALSIVEKTPQECVDRVLSSLETFLEDEFSPGFQKILESMKSDDNLTASIKSSLDSFKRRYCTLIHGNDEALSNLVVDDSQSDKGDQSLLQRLRNFILD